MELNTANLEYFKRNLKHYGYYLKKIEECERKLLDVRESIKDCRYATSLSYSTIFSKNNQPRNNSRIHDLLMEEGDLQHQILKYNDRKDQLNLDPLFELLNDEEFEIIKLHYFEGYTHDFIAVNKQYKAREILTKKIKRILQRMLKNYED